MGNKTALKTDFVKFKEVKYINTYSCSSKNASLKVARWHDGIKLFPLQFQSLIYFCTSICQSIQPPGKGANQKEREKNKYSSVV